MAFRLSIVIKTVVVSKMQRRRAKAEVISQSFALPKNRIELEWNQNRSLLRVESRRMAVESLSSRRCNDHH